MRDKCVTVNFSFDPAVLRYLENNFSKIDGAFDIRKGFVYSFIILCLQRNNCKRKMPVPSSFVSFIETTIVVKEWDFGHFGEAISAYSMIQVNNLLYKLMIRDACYRIMVAHVFAGIPRDTCIRDYLFECNFQENELSYEALRKFYQRNWTQNEKELRENFSFILEENEDKISTNKGQIRDLSGTYNSAKFVPLGFRY